MTRLLIALAALTAACGPSHLKPTDGEVEQMFIYHGTPADQPYHDATVSLHQDYGWGVSDPFCSGTLIFDRWVLTAAHCLYGSSAGEVVVKFGADGRSVDPQHLHAAKRLVVHSGYNPNTIANDIALIELSSTPTYADPIMPLPSSLGLGNSDEGDLIDLAGFGFQEDGGYGELMHIPVPIADVRSTEVEYDQGNGWGGSGGACNGDSGGPAFFERGGQVYVAGVTSYGDYACTDFGVSTRVDAFEAFIESSTGLSVEPSTGSSSGGGTPPSTTTTPAPGGQVVDTFSGTVTQGYLQAWVYVTDGPGVHTVELDGPAGTDFDLYLLHKKAGEWVTRAAAESPYDDETLVMDVPKGGKYAIGVAAYAGSGDYTVTLTRPE